MVVCTVFPKLDIEIFYCTPDSITVERKQKQIQEKSMFKLSCDISCKNSEINLFLENECFLWWYTGPEVYFPEKIIIF